MKEEKEQWMISSGVREGVIFIKEKINSVVFLSSSLKRCYTETRGIQSVCVSCIWEKSDVIFLF